jgi:hypothetical protein
MPGGDPPHSQPSRNSTSSHEAVNPTGNSFQNTIASPIKITQNQWDVKMLRDWALNAVSLLFPNVRPLETDFFPALQSIRGHNTDEHETTLDSQLSSIRQKPDLQSSNRQEEWERTGESHWRWFLNSKHPNRSR